MDPATVQSSQVVPAVLSLRRGRRRFIALAFLGVLLFLLLLVAALLWRATGPGVSLDLLRNPIESAVRARLPAGADVRIGATALSYERDRGVIVRARDVELDFPGAATINAEELSTVTTLAAVLARRVDLQAVAVSGIEIGISIPAGGRPGDAGTELIRRVVGDLGRQWTEVDDILRQAGLETIVVRDTLVRVLDGSTAPAPALQISEAQWAPLDAGATQARLHVVEEMGAGWDVTLERRHSAASSVIAFDIDGLPVAALAPGLADDLGASYRSAIALDAELTLDEGDTFSSLNGTLSTATATLSLTGRDNIEDARASIAFSLDATGDRIAVPEGEVRSQSGDIEFEGVADLAEPGGVTLVGRIRSGALPTARPDQPTVLTGGGAVMRIDFSDLAVGVERLEITTADGTVSAIGQASLGGASPGISLALSLTEMPADAVTALWPPFVATRTREWIEANVLSGMLGPATLQVALPPESIGERGRDRVLPAYALVGELPFREAEIRPLPSFPTIKAAAGILSFANATASVTAQSGVIEVAGMGVLQAAGTRFAIPELGRPEPWGELHLVLSGPATALAALSDTPPLSVASDRGINPAALSGEAQLELDARIPLETGGLDEIDPTFRLALTGFSSTAPIEARTIADADLVLEGSPQAFTVKGQGTLDGFQATVDLILGSGGAGQSDVTVSLDDAARERLGLDLDWLVQGPVQASIKAAGGEGRQLIALDLQDARVALSFLGWEKGPGVPATAHFLMERTEAGTRLTELSIAGSGFSAEGELSAGADGALRELNLSHVALRSGDDLAARITADGSGFDANVTGSALDARGILQAVSEGFGGETADIGPIDITLDIGAVTGQGDVVLSDLSGSLRVTGAGLDAASLRGAADNGRTFEWTLGREGDARTLRVFADNAGALIRFAGIYERIVGGSLILDYSGPVGGTGSGVALLRDFQLRGETALEPAVQTARRAEDDFGMTRVQAPASNDLTFTQLRVRFAQKDWVISINDAALRGPMLGATAEGTVNIADGRVAITGTFIPAFGINNLAGSIPVLGLILGGGRDEGLVGITYKLFGPLDGPEMTMNPISAIAPGIFRKIFEYQ